MGAPQDGSAEVLVIAAWGGATGFRARVTFSAAHGADRTSLAFSDRDQVLAIVEHWLARVDPPVIPGQVPDQTGDPPQPP